MITGLDHVGIAVSSIEESRGLYEALGLTVERVEEVPGEGVRVAIIPCGGARIELLEPVGEDSPVGRFLERHGPGIHHLCLDSDDLEAADARLRSYGCTLLRDVPTTGAEARKVQFVHPKSADGVLLELSQSVETGGSSEPSATVDETS